MGLGGKEERNEVIMEPLFTGALLGAAGSALVKAFDGPFKSIEDLWYTNFGYKTALKRAEYEAKVESFKQDLLKELSKIPEEKQHKPRLCVAGPAMEAAKYFVEEDSLRQMFAKLIASASDSSKFTKAHPAFVNIISQLAPFEANILQNTNILLSPSPCCKIRFQKREANNKAFSFSNMAEGHSIIEHFIIFENLQVEVDELELYFSLLDNITRLNLCEIPANYTLTNNALYDKYLKIPLLNSYLEQYKASLSSLKTDSEQDIFFLKETVIPTSFGKLFFEACIQQN